MLKGAPPLEEERMSSSIGESPASPFGGQEDMSDVQPEGVSATELVQRLEREFGIKIAGGQSELKGKIIRIAHLGHLDLVDVFSVLSAIELCLLMMGTEIEAGSGVRAALLEAANRIDVSKKQQS